MKKEIVFTGDVLNTAARIQGLCKALGQDLLLSGALCHSLHLMDHFQEKNLGEFELKGKNEKMTIKAITPL